MTAPIQEPNLYRHASGLQFGQNQLFRRPSPSLPSAVNPWISLSDGATIAPASGAFMPIPLTILSFNPNLVTQGDIFDWTTTDTGDPGNFRFVLTTIPEGWYAYELVTVWDQVTTPGVNDLGAATQRIVWNPGLNSPFNDNDHRYSADWLSNTYLEGNFEMLDNPWLRGNSKVFIGPAGGGGAQSPREWLLTAKQTTGSDRGLSGVWFYVEYLGADDSAEWTFEITAT